MDGGDDVEEARTAGGAFSMAESSDCLFERGLGPGPHHFTWLAKTHILQRLTAISRLFSFPLLSLLSFGILSLC